MQIGPRAFDATTVLNEEIIRHTRKLLMRSSSEAAEETEKWMKTNTGKIAHHYWAVFEKPGYLDIPSICKELRRHLHAIRRSLMEKAHEHVIFAKL